MLNNLIDEFKDIIDINNYFSYFNFEIVKEEIISSRANMIFLLGSPGSGKTFMINYLNKNFPERFFILNDLNTVPENKTLLVDEAQLLEENEFEKLRVLSDEGVKILFAMHQKEGEEIINRPQFKSRYYQKIYMKPLMYEDFEKFILNKFKKHQKEELLNKKQIKKIYKYSKGNFRLSKKILFSALNLLDFSLRNNLKYRKIDNCILNMALIDLELR